MIFSWFSVIWKRLTAGDSVVWRQESLGRQRPELPLATAFSRTAGMTLIVVVFFLIVMGGMGLAVGRISSNQHEALAGSTFSNDAYFTANAGIEWAVQTAVASGWSSTVQLSSLRGTYRLPNGNSFSLTYAADMLTSSASVNGSQRKISFKNFSQRIAPIIGAP